MSMYMYRYANIYMCTYVSGYIRIITHTLIATQTNVSLREVTASVNAELQRMQTEGGL